MSPQGDFSVESKLLRTSDGGDHLPEACGRSGSTMARRKSPLLSVAVRVNIALVLLLWTYNAHSAGFLRGEFFLGNGVSAEHGLLLRDSVGLEGFGKLSGERGDWATVALQVRLTRYRYLDMDNRIFVRNEWEPEFHTTYINFKGLFGRLNFKAGHLEVPFGLEPVIDTHSVLVPSTAMVNLGTMQDWGASLNGQLRWFDYEVALTSGAGMMANFNPFERERGRYLVSGRIQPVSSGNTQIGIAALIGEMSPIEHSNLDQMNDGGDEHTEEPETEALRSERRIGLDLRTPVFFLNSAFDTRLEVALGTRDGKSVVSFDGAVAREFGSSWRGVVGVRLWRHADETPDVWGLLSLRKQLTSLLAWEAMLSQDFSTEGVRKDTSLLTLIYFTR